MNLEEQGEGKCGNPICKSLLTTSYFRVQINSVQYVLYFIGKGCPTKEPFERKIKSGSKDPVRSLKWKCMCVHGWEWMGILCIAVGLLWYTCECIQKKQNRYRLHIVCARESMCSTNSLCRTKKVQNFFLPPASLLFLTGSNHLWLVPCIRTTPLQ